ncbi:MAG: hypothetical protein CMF62_00930 [Magnetococcales bacterium]|nr:hypothetical protein [Magnetococcales bacterium]|tara:strand:+ start:18937 stop:19140 length:204 start_codon:yes stop_codon:yes gene_type:complete
MEHIKVEYINTSTNSISNNKFNIYEIDEQNKYKLEPIPKTITENRFFNYDKNYKITKSSQNFSITKM